jgi:hypothetical protein
VALRKPDLQRADCEPRRDRARPPSAPRPRARGGAARPILCSAATGRLLAGGLPWPCPSSACPPSTFPAAGARCGCSAVDALAAGGAAVPLGLIDTRGRSFPWCRRGASLGARRAPSYGVASCAASIGFPCFGSSRAAVCRACGACGAGAGGTDATVCAGRRPCGAGRVSARGVSTEQPNQRSRVGVLLGADEWTCRCPAAFLHSLLA